MVVVYVDAATGERVFSFRRGFLSRPAPSCWTSQPHNSPTHRNMLGNNIPVCYPLVKIEKLKKDRAFYIGMPLNVERLEATWVRALAVEEIQATAYAGYTSPSRAYRVHGCRSPIPYPLSSARFNHSRNLGNPSSGRTPSSASSQGPGSYSTWQ